MILKNEDNIDSEMLGVWDGTGFRSTPEQIEFTYHDGTTDAQLIQVNGYEPYPFFGFGDYQRVLGDFAIAFHRGTAGRVLVMVYYAKHLDEFNPLGVLSSTDDIPSFCNIYQSMIQMSIQSEALTVQKELLSLELEKAACK